MGARGEWNPCCQCLFSSLPDELVIGEIFAYLTTSELLTASCVCTRWNYMAEAEPLWRSVSMQAPCSGVGLARLLARERPEAVQRLTLRRLQVGTEAELSSLADVRLPRLRELDLSGCRKADPEALTAFIARHGPSLRSLALDGLTCLSDAQVAQILAVAPGLRTLSLSGCRQLTDATVAALAQAPCAPYLASLNVTSCTGITGAALAAAVNAGLARGRLRELWVRGISRPCDALAVALATHTPLLTAIDVGHTNPFGTGGGAFVQSSPEAPSTSALTDVGLSALTSACRGIATLRLQGQSRLSDAALAASIGHLPALACLDLSGCKGAGESAAAALGSFRRPGLVELRLFGCSQLNDEQLLRMAKALPGLQLLDLHSCRSLSAQAIATALLPLSALKTIWLGAIPSVRSALAAGSAALQPAAPLHEHSALGLENVQRTFIRSSSDVVCSHLQPVPVSLRLPAHVEVRLS